MVHAVVADEAAGPAVWTGADQRRPVALAGTPPSLSTSDARATRHSALRLSARTIGAHFWFSAASNCASASGGPPIGTFPTLARAAVSPGDRSPSLTASLSLRTIAASVPAGANSPVHCVWSQRLQGLTL